MWIWQFQKDPFEKLTPWWGGLEARLEHGLSSQECSVTSSLEPQPSLIWMWSQISCSSNSKRWAALPAKIVEFDTPFP